MQVRKAYSVIDFAKTYRDFKYMLLTLAAEETHGKTCHLPFNVLFVTQSHVTCTYKYKWTASSTDTAKQTRASTSNPIISLDTITKCVSNAVHDYIYRVCIYRNIYVYLKSIHLFGERKFTYIRWHTDAFMRALLRLNSALYKPHEIN